MLKCCRGISQTKGHDQPFVRPIVCPKCSLVSVSFGDPDQVVSMSEVKVSIKLSFLWSIQKISEKG